MTKAELNRDIKRLWKAFQEAKENLSGAEYYTKIDSLSKEFLRLYRADREFEYMNQQSMKIMLSLNISHRIVRLHMFGSDIKIK